MARCPALRVRTDSFRVQRPAEAPPLFGRRKCLAEQPIPVQNAQIKCLAQIACPRETAEIKCLAQRRRPACPPSPRKLPRLSAWHKGGGLHAPLPRGKLPRLSAWHKGGGLHVPSPRQTAEIKCPAQRRRPACPFSAPNCRD